MNKILIITIALTLLVVMAACGGKSGNTVQTGKPIASVSVNSLTATLSNSTGQLKQGQLAYEGPAGSGKATLTLTAQ